METIVIQLGWDVVTLALVTTGLLYLNKAVKIKTKAYDIKEGEVPGVGLTIEFFPRK